MTEQPKDYAVRPVIHGKKQRILTLCAGIACIVIAAIVIAAFIAF